jgi:UDP-glucose 4-epimerase
VVNTSTGGAIYGDTAEVPTPETVPPRPTSAYGLSKWCAEQYADWFHRAHGLDVVTLRYGNVYGPRQDPTGDAGVIALFGSQLLAGEVPTIYGDGRQTRDFVFVEDVAAANLAVARASALPHRRYNIGIGVEVSVLELLDAVAAAAGTSGNGIQPRFAPARHGEIRRSCLAIDRAAAELHLGPMTSLADGLGSTLQWLAEPPACIRGRVEML